MKIVFYCGHPAHFHLLYNSYKELKKFNHEVSFVIKKKDVLEVLLTKYSIKYHSISNRESLGNFNKKIDAVLRLISFFWFLKNKKIDLLVGTSWENAQITRFFKIPSICLNEDDAKVVPLFARTAYKYSSCILTPIVCDNGSYNSSSIKYHSYHELAYLHPNHFAPSRSIVNKYFSTEKKSYAIIRFAKLTAHHDIGVRGLDKILTLRIIDLLSPQMQVFITSEKELEPIFEPYRINIDPIDIHHLMAYAELYIGDSQTMAAEAGVLGVPFIRFNDFVGKIGYLNELEEKYQLGFGITPSKPEILIKKIEELLQMSNRKKIFQERRKKMLEDKIELSVFLTWFIGEYPLSKDIMEKNPAHQFKYK